VAFLFVNIIVFMFETRLAVKTEGHDIHHEGKLWILIMIAMVLLAIAVGIFGTSSTGSGTVFSPVPTETYQPRTYSISYKAGVFSPTNLRIHSGDTVRFRNDGLMPIQIVSDPHPQHNDVVGLDSIGDIPPDGVFAYTFAAKGTFGYHNERNINETGTIIVR
jgi:plastocyanin